MRRFFLPFLFVVFPCSLLSQTNIVIDGNFNDWTNVPVAVADPADDVHETDGYSEGGVPPYVAYTDVDILEVKFTNDDGNLYGYIRATGQIGRTSADSLGHAKKGRYYFIFTIDVDDNDTTGYRLKDGGYYPDSRGYDMNMEVEFYNGGFNTGHYINHEFLTEQQMETQGIQDLAAGIVRLAPGTYDYYTQWVTFEDSSYVLVADKGPVYQGIITIAVSPDGHEAEMKAPFWGFLRTPEGDPIIDIGKTIVVSASLEASGELSEQAIQNGYAPGSKSVWGSDTADPFRYTIIAPATSVMENDPLSVSVPGSERLYPNYPNPFNPQTTIGFSLSKQTAVELFIVNARGQIVRRLVNGVQNAGQHRIVWHGSDENGNKLASGIYFTVFRTSEQQKVGRMLLLK